ncbi:uncharacterized protein LOC126385087 [Xyrichtys novacula]|uniref:Uncharacterized protein LOC126385087 n=1 Tax=Xyrichtys novacula TaxID=13765 RepID=A0AAV1EX41_XYRNO|nr:uncharacterized protein LOC126385087 [Xyrichtys novacula]
MAGAMKSRWLFACTGCGSPYCVTADIFAISRATVARIFHNVVEELIIILHRALHFPELEDMEEVGAGFAQLAGHEAFRCVRRNRQAVCDSSGKFLNTYMGNSGSVHDAPVLRRSPMYKESLYPPAGYVLLWDGGYPCLRHPVTIITPYRQPLAGWVEERFNNLCLATDDIPEEEHHEDGEGGVAQFKTLPSTLVRTSVPDWLHKCPLPTESCLHI